MEEIERHIEELQTKLKDYWKKYDELVEAREWSDAGQVSVAYCTAVETLLKLLEIKKKMKEENPESSSDKRYKALPFK